MKRIITGNITIFFSLYTFYVELPATCCTFCNTGTMEFLYIR